MKSIILSIFVMLLAQQIVVAQSGDDFFEKKDYRNAAIRYEIEAMSNPNAYLNLGKSYFALKDFDMAIEAFKNYKEKGTGVDYDNVNTFIELLSREDDYVEVKNIGGTINSGLTEAVPRISQDDKTLYFKATDKPGGYGGEDIWYSKKNADGTWGAPQAFSDLNTESHEALYSISGGGNVAILYGNYEGSFGGGDIFYSVKKPQGWTMPCNLGGAINTDVWESQANLAPDGKTLFFCSNRSGGQGGDDIYVSVLDVDGWSTPVNLGPKVNTSGGEHRPMMAADGKTLYFSSNGHPGFGGYDIFVTRKIGDEWTDWSEPVNLGKYINTLESDEDLSLPSSGTKAYTVKYNASDGYGDYDIYSFVIPPAMRPERVFNVYGTVTDDSDSTIGAIIRYYDFDSGKEITKTVSNPLDGKYEVSLPPYQKYHVIIDMKGYLYFTDVLDLTNPEAWMTEETLNEKLEGEWNNLKLAKAEIELYNKQLQALLDTNNTNISEGFRQYEHVAKQYKTYTANLDKAVKRAKLSWLSEVDDELIEERNYQLTAIKVGTKFELKNIVFDFGKATLTEESKVELDKLYDIMDRSDVIIELGGHTDNVGSEESNKKLSQDRVNSVREYLVGKGISSDRIAAVGYGEARPIATNETDEGRQKNRRVEVQITDIRPREGSDVLTDAELAKKEAEIAQFDLLSTMQHASKIGGLPKGSPCADEIGFLWGDKKPKILTADDLVDQYVPMEDYIFQERTARLTNFGYSSDTYSGGLIGVQYIHNQDVDNMFFMKFHGEAYLLGMGDSVKFQIGGGAKYAYQTMGSTGLPLFILAGADINLLFSEEIKGPDGTESKKMAFMLHVPIGAQYVYKYNEDIKVAPELAYYLGIFKNRAFDTKTGYLKIGANASYNNKFTGGLFYNMGATVRYFGFRAGYMF